MDPDRYRRRDVAAMPKGALMPHCTNCTFDRSLTYELSPAVLFRQFPAQTKMPTVSPTTGWYPVMGPQRAGS